MKVSVTMPSTLFLRLCFVMTGVNILDALFLTLPKEDIYLTNIVVEIPKLARIPRSSDPPKQMSVNFNISNDEMHFDLIQNEDINIDVPIYKMSDQGRLEKQQVPTIGNVRFYQDQKKGASFMIQTNRSLVCMVAIFSYKGDEYVMEPDHCSFERPNVILYTIGKIKRIPLVDRYTLKSDIKRSVSSSWKDKMKTRGKRRSTDYKIELFFIIDFSIYNYWYTQSKALTITDKDLDAKENILQFYSFVINGIDLRYKSIQASYKISMLFSGMYIADLPTRSQFVENSKSTTSVGTVVNSNKALKDVTNWIQASSAQLPNHDHAMMFTRYDMISGSSADVLGVAYLEALCTDQSVSVVEEHFDFSVLTIAAHELGHGLGAQHDGNSNVCTSSDQYIMAAAILPADNQNPWKFSTCSVNYFTTYIKKLNRDNNNCMTVHNSGGDTGTLENYTSLPGEVYDADSHCRHIVGPGSSFCKSVYNHNFSSICSKLWCKSSDASNTCTSKVGGDGLQCGNKKWCILGECKYDECAPPGDENCLYGDNEGIVLINPDKNVTCSFEDIKSRPYVCYQVEKLCCQQCKHFHTGITGCEYGDKIGSCSASSCEFNSNHCCGTCNSGSVLTTPSQEPTTPKYENPCKTTITTSTITVPTTSSTSETPVYVFRLTITLIIDIFADFLDETQKENIVSKVQAALTLFYQRNGVQFLNCTVRNIRKGSLIVEYDVTTPKDSKFVTQMTTLSKDMASGKSKVTYEGNEVMVSSVTLMDTSGDSLTIGSSTRHCEVQSIVGPCPVGYTCVESSNGSVCRESTEDVDTKQWGNHTRATTEGHVYLILAGVGAPLLSVMIVCFVCYCLKNRKLNSKGATNNHVQGVTNLAMDDFYQQRRQHYDKARYWY